MHNLLTDPIIRIVTTTGDERVTLPGLYAALMDDRVQSVTALRPHQRHALHAFLVQVGAMALLTAALPTPPQKEKDWLRLLLGLTPKWDHEPWCLIVTDLERPAFMQSPTLECGLQSVDRAEATPDGIDMLATAKNHDVKAARIANEPDAWLMALITVQTMDGYGGGGGVLAGISRMNSGSGSRPCVGLAPKGGLGARVRRDITHLVTKRPQALADHPGYAAEGGIGLVWQEPWVAAAPLTPDRLDPYYVEVCRRIRLVSVGGAIVARTPAGKMGTRITPPQSGLTGDPWAPVDRRADKLLTITGSGWDYRRIATILDPEKFKPALLQVWEPGDGSDGITLVMMGMARGSSTTDGYHERTIPIPPRVVSLFGGTTDRLGSACRERVQQADKMRSKVLYLALCTLGGGASGKIDTFLAAFDREVDRTFFFRLFDELGAQGDAARDQRTRWISELFAIAEGMLRQAEASAPVSQASRYRVVAAARSALAGAYHRNFVTQAAI